MEGSVFGTIVAGSVVLFLGTLVALFGYRLFLVLLPIYGFFFGLSFGAHSLQALFGDGFLATTTSWIVGFFVGLLFAALSYLFWYFAVALAAGSLGYGLVAGLFSLTGADLDVLVWILGVLVGLVFAVGAIALNLQKVVVIVATALFGAWAVVGTFLFLFTDETPERLAEDGMKLILDDHPGWFVILAIVAAVGIVFQWVTNRRFEIDRYNRWEEYSVTAGPPSSLSE
jgi:Domain of unknown function (DUF4203)